MKTLDEVIDRLQRPSKAVFEPDGLKLVDRDYLADALNYLKEFQGLSKMWNDRLDKEQDNSPLTWDELRQMVGKPVWVEYHGMNRWVIPEEYRHDIIGREYILVQDGGMMFRFQQHEVWEAYRKERE